MRDWSEIGVAVAEEATNGVKGNLKVQTIHSLVLRMVRLCYHSLRDLL